MQVQVMDTQALNDATNALWQDAHTQTLAATDTQNFGQMRQNAYALEAELVTRWKTEYLFPKVADFEFNNDVLERLYVKAYADGHSAGYGEVEYYFIEFADLANDLRVAGL